MERENLFTLLLFALPVGGILIASIWLQQRRSRPGSGVYTREVDVSRKRIADLLQDDIGQKFAAARVNLSAVRAQLRTGGLKETVELDTAMSLLDDGCRDLRTVSRLMAAEEPGMSAADLKTKTSKGN